MKVLFIQNIEAIAGSEKYFLQLLPELQKQGIEVGFFNFHKKEHKPVAAEFSLKLKALGVETFHRTTSTYLSPRLLFRVRAVIREHNYQIVHSHLVYADFLVASLKALFYTRFKFVSTLHGYQENLYYKYCLEPGKLPKTLYYYLMKFAVGKMDGVYACSYGLKNFFEGIGIKHKRQIGVIHHGFSYPRINRKNLAGKRLGDPQLVIVGRLIKRKGHHFVIGQLGQLVERYPSIKLVVVGSGGLEGELKQLAENLNLSEHVAFEGYREDTLEYMSASDVVLVPSYSEGLPLVIFEAFYSQVPVVAFDTIGCNEAVKHGETGILVKPFSGHDFMEKVSDLLQDKEKRFHLAANAQRALEFSFSKEKMVTGTIKFYRQLSLLPEDG